MIYKLNNKQIKEEIKEFLKITYGKIVCLLSYCVPTIVLIFFLSFEISMMLRYQKNLLSIMYFCAPTMILAFILFLISFVLGSMYFYSKLEKFIDSKKDN
jgi:uncharacterized membrane protein (DUF485 family)